MLFKAFKSVPANTTKENPTWEKLTITKGVIKAWIIFSDPEAANVLHYHVDYHKASIMPMQGVEWLTAFFASVPILDNIKIDDPPYVLDIYAYNEDDSYPHEYYIHPIVIPEKPVSVVEEEEGFWERIAGHLGIGG